MVQYLSKRKRKNCQLEETKARNMIVKNEAALPYLPQYKIMEAIKKTVCLHMSSGPSFNSGSFGGIKIKEHLSTVGSLRGEGIKLKRGWTGHY